MTTLFGSMMKAAMAQHCLNDLRAVSHLSVRLTVMYAHVNEDTLYLFKIFPLIIVKTYLQKEEMCTTPGCFQKPLKASINVQ